MRQALGELPRRSSTARSRSRRFLSSPNHQVVGVSYLVAEILDNRVEHLSEQLNVAIIKVE